MTQCLFHIGQHVRLVKGKTRMTVLNIQYIQKRNIWMIQAAYDSDIRYRDQHPLVQRKFRDQYDFVAWNENESKEILMNDLYQTKEEPPRFGTMLTKNSAGQIVLEMKGENGKVEAFDPEKIEIVLPYTIALKSLTNENSIVHISAKEGDFKEGDLLLEPEKFIFYMVVGTNTKNRSPANLRRRHFYRIPAEKITISNDD